ncbi:hypothetical protein [Rubritalea tangerina]
MPPQRQAKSIASSHPNTDLSPPLTTKILERIPPGFFVALLSLTS